jgi:putative membrane protein
VGDAYWAAVRDRLVEGLRTGPPRDAVVAAVREVGRVLAAHFPPEPGDVDELTDQVSLG